MNLGRTSSACRGAALLIVLSTLVIILAASASIAQIAATMKQRAEFHSNRVVADDLLRAAQSPILHWLQSRSAFIVLPPDAPTPSIEVMHDQITIEGTSIEVQIRAFDQCGMAPIDSTRSSSSIRDALPQVVVQVLDRVELPNDVYGLDQFSRHSAPLGITAFPTCSHSKPSDFGDPIYLGQEVAPDPTSDEPASAIGLHTPTHNPAPNNPGAGKLNVNTAPIALVEAAMRSAGIGGIEQIIAARANGKLANAPNLKATLQVSKMQFVSRSSVWSFRIDIRVGRLRRSWWAVYIQGSREWECVQRLAIAE